MIHHILVFYNSSTTTMLKYFIRHTLFAHHKNLLSVGYTVNCFGDETAKNISVCVLTSFFSTGSSP